MRRIATTMSGLGFLWAAAATVYLLTTDPYAAVSTTAALDGIETPVGLALSLVSAEGVWMVALLGCVTMVSGLPLGVALAAPEVHRGMALGVGALVLGFSVVSGFSIGLVYLPAGLVLVMAGMASPRRPRAASPSQAG